MARYLGKNASVTAGGNAISSVEQLTLDEQAEVFTSIALGDTSATQDVGINSGSGTITVFDDPDDSSGQGALTVGASVSIVIYKRGSSNTASPTRSFTAIIQSVNEPLSRDYARTTYNFVVSGDITRVLP